MFNRRYNIKIIVSLIVIFAILSVLLFPQARNRSAKPRNYALYNLVFLIIVLSFGIISSLIATYKGRNNWCWFFLGMFPPWGLLLILFLPKTQEAKENDAFRNGAMRKCPYCAELIKTEAFKCKYCGEESTAISRK